MTKKNRTVQNELTNLLSVSVFFSSSLSPFKKLDTLTFKLTVFFKYYVCVRVFVFILLHCLKANPFFRFVGHCIHVPWQFFFLGPTVVVGIVLSAVHFVRKASLFFFFFLVSCELVSISLFICNKLPSSFAVQCA